MLNLTAPLDDGSSAPSGAAAKPGRDSRADARKALKHWPTVYNMLVGLNGRPTGEVCRLNAAYVPQDPGRARPHGEARLVEFMGPDYREDSLGAWVCRGNGASGKNLVELIQYLSGGCDRRVAADFLSDLVGRLVELPA